MSKRWVSIIGGLLFLGAFNSALFSGLYGVVEMAIEIPDFLYSQIIYFLIEGISMAGLLMIAKGLFRNKLDGTILTGLGLIIGCGLVNIVASMLMYGGSGFTWYGIKNMFSYFFSWSIHAAPACLLVVMAAVVLTAKKRKTRIYNVPAILYFAISVISFARNFSYIKYLGTWEKIVEIFERTSTITAFTLAYLFLGMFIEGRGIAFEKDDREWFEKEFLND